MEDQLARLYSRGGAADDAARDEEADAAFMALTQEVIPERAVSPRFTDKTMAAIAEATAADARRIKWMRKALVVAAISGVVAACVAAPLALSLISNGLVAGLNWIVAAIVWVAAGPHHGLWSVVGSLGRAAAAFIAEPSVTVAM